MPAILSATQRAAFQTTLEWLIIRRDGIQHTIDAITRELDEDQETIAGFPRRPAQPFRAAPPPVVPPPRPKSRPRTVARPSPARSIGQRLPHNDAIRAKIINHFVNTENRPQTSTQVNDACGFRTVTERNVIHRMADTLFLVRGHGRPPEAGDAKVFQLFARKYQQLLERMTQPIRQQTAAGDDELVEPEGTEE